MARRENVAHCADGEVQAGKRKPRRLTDGRGFGAQALRHSEANCSGLLAVRPVVEDQKADEERDGKAPGQKVEIHD